MQDKEFHIKTTVYATKTIVVDAKNYEEACEIAESEMNNKIYNFKVDFSYEFEETEKKQQYNDEDYDYRYEHNKKYYEDFDPEDEEDQWFWPH